MFPICMNSSPPRRDGPWRRWLPAERSPTLKPAARAPSPISSPNSPPAPGTATALEAHPVTRRHPRSARAFLCLFLYLCSPRWLRTAGAARCSFPNVYYLFIVIYNLPLPRRCLCREGNYLCFLVKSIKSLKAGTRAECLTRAISRGPTSPGGAAGEGENIADVCLETSGL